MASRKRRNCRRRSKISSGVSLESAPLSSIDLGLSRRFKTDKTFLNSYLRTWAANEVASGLKAMRKLRSLRQQDLAASAHTGQSAISRIEKRDYDGWTFKTLLNMALILRARLDITFVPVEDVIRRFEAKP